jgi:hypothetical protein
VRRAEAAKAEEDRERVSTQAARQRIAAAEQHAAGLIADAEARAEAIRDVREELTGRLLQVRQLLNGLPDLSDRPQQATSTAPAPAAAPAADPAREQVGAAQQPAQAARTATEHRPRPTPQPASAGAQPARGDGEAAAARQPVRPLDSTGTRQLPLPNRTGSTVAGQNPPTQSIDEPVGPGGR